ncbi:MAG: ParB N-terminal domain-containing protein [Patescibacteria group bacterium]|jgi:ParB/RepB/Spo0J family partition protein|nr:ParB N-terminal domain-containing protein [Patescibacteria group bacterium]
MAIDCNWGKLDGKTFVILHLDPEEIIVLPQMRRTFNEATIRELAESIRANGQINEALINHRQGRYELIAGERRLRAIRYLNKQTRNKKRKRTLSCKMFESLTTSDAFQLQVAENVHENVPPEQEAEALYGLWQIKMGTPELEEMSMRSFCKLVGKSETKVRGAFRFIQDLHPLIQKEVRRQGAGSKREKGTGRGGRISYTTAIEIARLKDQGEQLFALQIITARKARSLKAVKACLKPYMDRQRGQTELVDLGMTAEDAVSLLVRYILEKETPHYRDGIEYKRDIISAVEQGVMPETVLTDSVVRLFLESLHLEKRLRALVATRKKQFTA